MVINCVGDNENAWISLWDYNPTNPQNRDCLAIYVGYTGPGGGIDAECVGSRYSLCMVTRKKHTNVTNVCNYGTYNSTATVTATTTKTVILPGGIGPITTDNPPVLTSISSDIAAVSSAAEDVSSAIPSSVVSGLTIVELPSIVTPPIASNAVPTSVS